MPRTYTVQGRYFEGFELGETAVTPGRTISEADIVNFAGVSGDYTQIHTNADSSSRGPFRQRIAHGLLGLAVASGLLSRLGLLEGTVLAFREMTWKFSLPIFIGDTVHTRTTVSEVKPMPRVGGGALTLDVELVNQEHKVVQSGQWRLLVASKPAS
jgi:3-hydroxybutyryl-CoA dehydratase